jgi:serine protease AprX
VAGIITSSGVVSAPGVAGGAGIVAIKVDGGGGPSLSDTEAALDWVLSNHAEFEIRVVNVSLSDEGQYNNSAAAPCSGSNIANTIRDLHLANVAVFVSSGNNGHYDGISLPACTEAISVGGVYDQASLNGTWCLDSSCSATCTDTNVDLGQFACFSNSDEILDILAPSWLTAAPDLDAGLQGFGGTSAAAAFASGAAALLIEETPTLTPGELRTLLKTHGPPVTNPENGLSFTRLDVAAAYPRAVVPTGSAHTLVVLLGLGGLVALRLIRRVEPPEPVTHQRSEP